MNDLAPVGLFMDFYGTIADGDRLAVEGICREIVDQYHLSLAADELVVRWGRCFFETIGQANGPHFRTLFECECDSLSRTLAQLGVCIRPEPHARKLQDYWRRPPLHDDALDALARIKLPICVLSNADHHDLLSAIRHVGLDFDHVVSSQQARSYKPHTGIFELALRRTGWAAAEVLHVGDSLHSDIGGAQAAGLRAVWLRRPGRISDLPAANPDYTVDDLHQLAAMLHSRAGPSN